MTFDQLGGFALTGSAFVALVVILFRTYLLTERERSTLLDRYQLDIAARDATITTLNAEIVALRVALDACRDRA